MWQSISYILYFNLQKEIVTGVVGFLGDPVHYHAEEGPKREIELKQYMRAMEGRVLANQQTQEIATAMSAHVRKIHSMYNQQFS